ncbi:MAG TPA: transcription antitermination factor NusB [Candidatus Saccharimonadales bacterium]|nr:transcription antitermination factor NusB [Candidatus Saccharimonadales bacterium]
MASNRHLGRIIALQTLYELDFRRDANDTELKFDDILTRNIARYKDMVDDVDFVRQLVSGVDAQSKALDERLQPIAPEWPIDQIARMDRVVLRIGLYELENEKDVPPKVVINEAVELAKAFGGENSSKFINGVLGTALRQLNGETEPTTAKPAVKPKPARKTPTKKKSTTKQEAPDA